jgi:hypothetical protein
MQHSTTHPRIAAITQPPGINKTIFVFALAFFGVIGILSGIMNLVAAIIQLSSGSLTGVASTVWIDIAFNLSLGGLILASLGAFTERRMLSIWLYAASIIVDGIYHLMMGYPLNYLFMGFGLLLIWQLLKFRNELELG